MTSQHANPALTTRPPRRLRDTAKTALAIRHREMEAFITACLTALTDNPDGFLATLAPHWPPPRPRGRPRTSQEPDRPERP